MQAVAPETKAWRNAVLRKHGNRHLLYVLVPSKLLSSRTKQGYMS